MSDKLPAGTRAKAEKAVKATQVYLSSHSAPVRTQQRFYDKMVRAIESLARHVDTGFNVVYDEVVTEAKKRGKVILLPGQHF